MKPQKRKISGKAKLTMVIPTYWTRGKKDGWKPGDAVYDHPAPLDENGTLFRTLESLKILKDKNFRLAIIAVAAAKDIENRVEAKVAGIVKSVPFLKEIETALFASSGLKKIRGLFKKEHAGFLRLRGYSDVRNFCLFAAHIPDSEAAVLIDDDEIFEDPDFISKAKEFLGEKIDGETVNAVAGYYIQPDGGYRVKKPFRPWMKYWDKYESMNEALGKIIGTEPRIKKTPFAFGGNMIIGRDLFYAVPFEPDITRGEDIDYLINARMFGFPFFLDNRLTVKHLPPPKTHPVWMQMREDIFRFVYERAKIEGQKETKGMTRVFPADFDPYPGRFLRRDLEEKIEKSSELLAKDYFRQGDKRGGKETQKNIILARTDAVPKRDPFLKLLELQKRWREFMDYSSRKKIRSEISKIVNSATSA